VEGLEKSGERGVTWRFILRLPDGSADVVELQGDEIHGALRDGDEVRVRETDRKRGEDVLHPQSLENQTLGVRVTVHRGGSARRLGKELGKTAATAVVSSLSAAAVTLALAGGNQAEQVPEAPGDGAAPSDEPSLTVTELAGLSVFEFVVLWLIWFAIWGRRWHRRAQALGTAAIAAAALLAFAIGLAVR
jgi:hypothetical protein